MDVREIADRLAITDLINRSVAGVLRRDPDLWGGTWAEDARWKIDLFDQPLAGREAIVAAFRSIIDRFSFVSMTAFVGDLELAGDVASGMVYSQELMFPKAGGQKILCGCFHDDYVRTDGRWQFAARRYETLYRSTLIETAPETTT